MKLESDPAVKGIIAAFPESTRLIAQELRSLVLEVADSLPEIDRLEETLKWGQPSYSSSVGTPLRIGAHKSGDCAIFTHCQSSVIGDFAAIHGDAFCIDGNRAVVFRAGEDLQPDLLRGFITHALTYKIKR